MSQHPVHRPATLLNLSVDRRRALGLLGFGLLAASCSGSGGKGTSGASVKLKPVPAAQRIPADAIKGAASFTGTYQGTWSGGNGTGTATVKVSLDSGRRTATGDITLDPGFFGSGTPSLNEHLDFNLDDYAYEMPPYQRTSEIFGPVILTGPGRGFVRLDGTAIPHHPEIKSFSIQGVLTGPGASANGDLPFRYEMHQANGNVVAGALTFHSPG